MILHSSAFVAGGTIPQKYSCFGENISPPLQWSGAPAGVKSFALIVRDPDAPGGSYVHWVIYNLPSKTDALPPAMAVGATLENGAMQGVNSAGTIGYHGPCPPPGPPHHYHFRLYALDSTLDLKPGAPASRVEQAARNHTLATAEIVGVFGR
jgi:Raf kinase inhibitor-like YbhB/YbcL family protein